ncbi:putative amidohydrolase [Dokdonella fugitiva]|jgi:predicted amidohydrolase|uniref:Putative amidohydrolase n=1 Tax=Dokdonella fugitiva TaxID=328517 RepID=A0A4R2I7L4_9GAMM|nr:putative amidohydrolase [Dokdonella fugitiva]TCO40323.1 putative amidohydrolase [Dokdonella fugitiva]
MSLRVAVAQYRIGEPADFAAFAARVAARVDIAARAGAQCVVLPEYLALEAAAAQPGDVRADFVRSLEALQGVRADYEALARELARRHAIHLVAGTFITSCGNGRYRNRAWLATPEGRLAFQDKLTLTGFERASGVIEAGDVLKVFETGLGRIAIDVCYDIEFPLYARAQAEAGANLLLVPSCTDTEAGANRVRIGCQARALENQAFVACAVTAGIADWSPALDCNTGIAAVYTPVDRGFPADGIAAAATDGGDWAMADVDLDALAAARREGQVANATDWPAQQRPALARARVERA